MADVAEKRMTVAEFLNWDDGTDARYELIDGRPVAMAPVAPSHSIVVANASHELKSRLQGPCYVGSEAGIERPDRDDTSTRPTSSSAARPSRPIWLRFRTRSS